MRERTTDELRHLIADFASKMREAVAKNPGRIVLYDPIASADALDAILREEGATTEATDAAAQQRAGTMLEVVKHGAFQLCIVTPSVARR